jgi:hypothetical protein
MAEDKKPDTDSTDEPEDETRRRFREALAHKHGHDSVGGSPHEPGRTIVPHTNDKRQRTFRRKSGG